MSNQPAVRIEYEPIIKKWEILKKDVEDSLKAGTDEIFKSLKAHIFEKIIHAVNNDNRLAGYDEKIFEALKCLMDYYQKAVCCYNDNKNSFTSHNLINLLEGLYSVIYSRINQFDEYPEAADSAFRQGEELNPILLEKKQILERQVKVFVKRLDDLKQDISCASLINNFNPERDFILKYIINKHTDDLYNSYAETVRLCISSLNDLEGRDITEFYYGLMEQEKENLAAIMKIQVSAIEMEAKTKDEETIVQEMLKFLREGYQYGVKEITEITDRLREAQQKGAEITLEDIEVFKESLFDIAVPEDAGYERLTKEYDDLKEMFCEAIDTFITDSLNRSAVNLYTLKRMIMEEKLLSEEINEVFASISEYTKENSEELLKTQYMEIIDGILETVNIKTENIEESMESFLLECDKILESGGLISEAEKRQLSDGALKKFISACTESTLDTESIREAADGYICEQAGGILQRNQASQTDLIYKKVLRFLREQLLYEISTFEEIMNYSVARLRGDLNEAAEGYVRFMDGAALRIDKILRKYNIELIRPGEHDLFNGKEHEVLIAEKNDGFNKGEIIKLMNSGYKRNDTVIIRANVIAAK